MLELEFNNKERTSSFWNEAQPLVNHSVGSQSASPVNRDNTAAANNIPNPRSHL